MAFVAMILFFCKYMPLPCFGRGAESGVIPRFRDCFRRHGRWSLFGSGFMAVEEFL